MSLQSISDLLAQLAEDGVPEPVALLIIARRSLDESAAMIAGKMSRELPAVARVWRQLGAVARDVVALRDDLDEALGSTVPGESLPPIDPVHMAHFIAIQSALGPARAAIVRGHVSQLAPRRLREWFADYAALSVPDAVKRLVAVYDMGRA